MSFHLHNAARIWRERKAERDPSGGRPIMTMTTPTTETGIVELLACPFCGGNAGFGERSYKTPRKSGVQAGFTVNCMKPSCLAVVAGLESFDTKSEAAAAWNTRAAMPDSTQLLQTMAGALEAVAKAERDYRVALLTHGNGSYGSGLAWKAMKRAGDAAREVIAQFRAQEQRS